MFYCYKATRLSESQPGYLNPADVFYYSGDCKDDGCLAIGKDCWISPMDLKGYWQPPFDLKVLILAGCPALHIDFPHGLVLGRGGPRSLSRVARSPQSWGTGIKLPILTKGARSRR
jgi:hypothetical protein